MDLERAAVAAMLLYLALQAAAEDGLAGASGLLVQAEAICPGLGDATTEFAETINRLPSSP